MLTVELFPGAGTYSEWTPIGTLSHAEAVRSKDGLVIQAQLSGKRDSFTLVGLPYGFNAKDSLLRLSAIPWLKWPGNPTPNAVSVSGFILRGGISTTLATWLVSPYEPLDPYIPAPVSSAYAEFSIPISMSELISGSFEIGLVTNNSQKIHADAILVSADVSPCRDRITLTRGRPGPGGRA